MKKGNPYDTKYAGEDYYWGKKPSAICDMIIEIMQPSSSFRPRLLDLGCGEGRNVVYFAKHGFDVVGLDVSRVGLEKTKRYAQDVGVQVETIHADILNYHITNVYDVIFSTGTLHYLQPNIRNQCFQDYKNCTSQNGVNAFSVFVAKPFIPKAPDVEKDVYPYKSGELMGYYWDWEIVYSIEEIFDCMSSGVPHKHAVNRIIARRHHSS